MPEKFEFAEAIVARLTPLGPVKARRMFGGHGIFLDDTMFALLAGDTLYFKVDGETKSAFAAAGAKPFIYRRKAKPIEMSYMTAPPGSLDDQDTLLDWAERALAAAKRQAKPKRRRPQKT